jgi:hypothetical protein
MKSKKEGVRPGLSPLLNPNRALGFMLDQVLFLASCKDVVEGIAGYDETISATRCKNKADMT